MKISVTVLVFYINFLSINFNYGKGFYDKFRYLKSVS